MKKGRAFHQLHPALLALIDVVLIAVALNVFALFDFVLPRRLDVTVSEENQRLIEMMRAQETQVPLEPVSDLSAKFSDRFTDGEPIMTQNSYTGRNVSLTVYSGQMSNSVYFVTDIYLRDIDCLRTAFGKDTYGKGYREDALDIASRNGAIAAINGDFYYMGSLNAIIRNGEVYRDAVDPFESLCALFRDGSMEVYDKGNFSVSDLIAKGVWQTWSFGPSLLDEEGHALTQFERKNPEPNPRTAIGMVEPGHYMFIVADGRQDGYSEGLSYVDLAKLCEQLGLKLAYNLDGGGTTRMIYNNALVSHPSEGREVSDIIYVIDTE